MGCCGTAFQIEDNLINIEKALKQSCHKQISKEIAVLTDNGMNTAPTSLIALTDLPLDIIRNIVTYNTLEEYAFSILQLNKALNRRLSPRKSPMIMSQLIMQNGTDCLLEITPMGFKTFQAFDILRPVSIREQMEEWQIMATFAWQNQKRRMSKNIELILSQIDQQKLEKKSVYSSLYLLHFLYKCRYGQSSSKNAEL